jgi:nitrogen fixation protein NifU and related proteins
MSPYSELVKQHFSNPRNVGKIEDFDGIGEVGNPVCGDTTIITIKVKDGRLADIKFETLGCGAAVAVSSIVTEKARGKTLDEALQITGKTLAADLGELPKNELHCSHLGPEALHKAIMNYYDRQAGRTRIVRGGKDEHVRLREEHCYCPYCEHEVSSEAPVCANCGKSRT